MDKKILDKIKKCLALARSSNANEAAIALGQAQKLMARHGITDADLELSEINQADVHACNARNPTQWVIALMCMVAEAFGCEPVLGSKLKGADVSFIGPGSQPEIAAYAYTVLYRQLRADRGHYISSLNIRLKASTKTRRGDLFAEAWVTEAAKKVQKMVRSEHTSQLIETYKEQHFTGLSETKGRICKPHKRDHAASLEGRVKGRQAQLHHGMGGTAEQQLRIGGGV